MQDFNPNDGNPEDLEQLRARLESALSHPENVDALRPQLEKLAQIQAQQQRQQAQPQPLKPLPLPSANLFAKGCLLVSVLLIGAAMATPTKTSYDVCFNPKPLPNQPQCLGAKKYRIDEDRLSEITQHSGVHAINRVQGHPLLAIGLGVIGTVFAGAGTQATREALKVKTSSVVSDRLKRRHGWTQEKIQADASVKASHEATQHGVNYVEVYNAHTLTAESAKLEFASLHQAIASLPPQLQDQFVNFLALKEAEQQAQAQMQAQLQARQQDPLTQLFGTTHSSPESSSPGQSELSSPASRLTSTGGAMIENLVTADRSIIFLGVPGSGKSVSMRVLIGRMRKLHGEKLELYAIGSKGGDSFAGIKTISYSGNLEEAYNTLIKVYAEHRHRQDNLPANQRQKIGHVRPICLIFDDYKNFCDRMKTAEGKIKVSFPGSTTEIELSDAFSNAMSDIAFNGREGGIKLIIGTQASNVTDLPFLGSAQARESVILCYQARQNPDNKANGFGVIDGVLKNANVIGDAKTRQDLTAQYPNVKTASISTNQPVILSSVTDDGMWALGLVPNLTKEDYELEASYAEVNEINESLDELEADVEETKLSGEATALRNFLVRTNRKQSSIRELTSNFKINGQRFNTNEIKRWLNEIVEANIAAWVNEAEIELKDF
ncbi:MAG: hypothetical protein ICV78_12970 [Tolypothrix sp. Co-bin9]|nr:hypothetical protein [Tolypothrix sp. Co-bin9]